MLKISAFYLDKQKCFVPNATKLCNSCNMMFDVSNYLYVVKPITVNVVVKFRFFEKDTIICSYFPLQFKITKCNVKTKWNITTIIWPPQNT